MSKSESGGSREGWSRWSTRTVLRASWLSYVKSLLWLDASRMWVGRTCEAETEGRPDGAETEQRSNSSTNQQRATNQELQSYRIISAANVFNISRPTSALMPFPFNVRPLNGTTGATRVVSEHGARLIYSHSRPRAQKRQSKIKKRGKYDSTQFYMDE